MRLDVTKYILFLNNESKRLKNSLMLDYLKLKEGLMIIKMN